MNISTFESEMEEKLLKLIPKTRHRCPHHDIFRHWSYCRRRCAFAMAVIIGKTGRTPEGAERQG
jgi:hypothetical protein